MSTTDEEAKAQAEFNAVKAIWADIAAPGGIERLIERAGNQKELLRRAADGGYTPERTKAECEAAAFIISQLTTALSQLRAQAAEERSEFSLCDIAGAERRARELWRERQEDCAKHGADIPMPTVLVRVDELAEALSFYSRAQAAWRPDREEIARAICRSGKYETGMGTCAPICMEQLGDARAKGCCHAYRIHGSLTDAILALARAQAAWRPDRVEIAEIIDPTAFEPMTGHVPVHRQSDALRKADAILALSRPQEGE